MMRKLLITFSITLLLISCGSLPEKSNILYTSKNIELGVVGEKSTTIRKTNFQVFGIPNYLDKIKLNVSVKPFTEKIYKKYLKNSTQNQVTNSISYSDSITPKPSYIDISIEDRVMVTETLNKQKDIFNYLRKSPNASLVTSIRMVADKNIHNQLQQADAFYLQTDTHKKQWLLIYKNEKEIKKIDMNSSIVFGYDIATFC